MVHAVCVLELECVEDYDVTRLSGTRHDIYRTRIGDYRIYSLRAGSLIGVLHETDRNSAYRNPDRFADHVRDFLSEFGFSYE